MARSPSFWSRLGLGARAVVCLIVGMIYGCSAADPSLAEWYQEAFPPGIGTALWLLALPFKGREGWLYVLLGLYAWLLASVFWSGRRGWTIGIVLSLIPGLCLSLVHLGIDYYHEGILEGAVSKSMLIVLLHALLIWFLVLVITGIRHLGKRVFTRRVTSN